MFKYLKITFTAMAVMLTATAIFAFAKPTDTFSWRYTGDSDPAEFNQAGNWDLGESTTACDDISELPCQIDNVETDDRGQLQLLLNNYEGEDIFQIASQKPAP